MAGGVPPAIAASLSPPMPTVLGMDGVLERAAVVALLRHHGSLGWSRLAERVEDAGNGVAVLHEQVAEGQQDLLSHPDAVVTEQISQAQDLIHGWASAGIQCVMLLDEAYPSQLLTVHQ